MTPIATKTLELRANNKNVDVRLSLYAPEPVDGGWECRYDIGWPNNLRTFRMAGANGLQALILALQSMGAEIYASEAHKQGRLVGATTGYGIPVPPNFRQDLVGDDKKTL